MWPTFAHKEIFTCGFGKTLPAPDPHGEKVNHQPMLAKWKSSEHVSYKPVVTGLQPTKRWYSYSGFEIISSIFEACKAKMGQIYSLQRYLHGPFIYQALNLIR